MESTKEHEQQPAWPDGALQRAMGLLERCGLPRLSVIDVGAHFGETLESVHTIRTTQIKYLALEPNPNSFEQLQKTANKFVAKDFEVSCMQVAAGPNSGMTRFFATQASAVSGVLRATTGQDERVPTGDHHIVDEFDLPMISLDDHIEKAGISVVDLLKIDVEGYDLEVLVGAARSLADQKVGAVVVEVFFVPYRDGQAYFWDIAQYLGEFGYSFVNLYDTRETGQGRLYTGNGLWVSSATASANDFL